MKASVDVRNELYQALSSDSTLKSFLGNPARIYWLGKVNKTSTFPLVNLIKLDESGAYAFGLSLEAADVDFETRIYVDPQDADATGYKIDKISQAIRTVMTLQGYRQISSSGEVLDPEIDKVVFVSRWSTIVT